MDRVNILTDKGMTGQEEREKQDHFLSILLATILFFHNAEFLLVSIGLSKGMAVPVNHPAGDLFFLAARAMVPLVILVIWLVRKHYVTRGGRTFILFSARLAAYACASCFAWQAYGLFNLL